MAIPTNNSSKGPRLNVLSNPSVLVAASVAMPRIKQVMPHLNDWYIRCRLAFSVSDFSSFRVSGEECAATSLLTVSRSMPQLRQNLCSRVVSAPQVGQCIKVSQVRDY